MKEFVWYLSLVPNDLSDVESKSTLCFLQGETILGKSYSGISDADVKMLKRHFGVHADADLVRKEFTSEHDRSHDALDLFLVTLRNGGKYTPPPFDDVLYRVGLALANFTVPDYSDVDAQTLRTAFSIVWENPAWIEGLKEEVKKLSRGYVTLTVDTARWMPTRGLGTGHYLHLILGDQVKIVCIGPYGISAKLG